MGGIGIMAYRGIDAFHLVSRNAGAYSGAAQQYSPFGISGLDFPAQFFRIIRVIDAFRTVRSQIDGLMTALLDDFNHVRFQRKAGVVTGDGNFHITLL